MPRTVPAWYHPASSALRILIDYRPALRQRTGVGEYVHELARALVQSAPSGELLTLFSSSWKDRLPQDAIAGARTIDRRIPVRLLNFAWHRSRFGTPTTCWSTRNTRRQTSNIGWECHPNGFLSVHLGRLSGRSAATS